MYWYEDEVKRLENDRLKIEFEPETLFYGSSSMRLWTNMYKDFGSLKPFNLGFGGSTLAACVWFFDRVMQSYQPRRLIIYAGDNDLGDGRCPEEIFIFFQQLVISVKRRFGDIPCYFVSIKPSISRWNKVNELRYANYLIREEITKYHTNWHFIDIFNKMLDSKNNPKKEYFAADGLHLSEKGYQLWKDAINNEISGNH